LPARNRGQSAANRLTAETAGNKPTQPTLRRPIPFLLQATPERSFESADG
jgi:hypothetical protein